MAIRRLFLWSLCLACLLLIFGAGQLHPLAYLVMGALLPLPVILAGVRLGSRAALLLVLAVLLVAVGLTARLVEHLGLAEMLLLGLLVGAGMRRGWTGAQTIVTTATLLTLVFLVLFLGQAVYLGLSPQALLAAKSRETMAMFRQLLDQSGVGQPGLHLLGLPPAEVQNLLRQLLPALGLINTVLVTWLNVVLARQLSYLRGWGGLEPPLCRWQNPEWLIFPALGAAFLALVPLKAVRLVSLNLLVLFAFLYFCQGMAVTAAWLNRFQVPRLLRVLGYLLFFMNPLFLVVMLIGLLDLWLDFRRLNQALDA